jgi:NDP-sugar pyrophosphorylase family protein
MRPHTESTPKALLPVAGMPIIERLVLHLVGNGIQRIYIAVGHLADSIVQHLGDGARLGCSIEYLREDPDEPLGTAGWMSMLPEPVRAAQTTLVMNADLVTNFSVGRMLAQHRDTGAAATVGVAGYSHQVPFGVVRSQDGVIHTLVEKPVHRYLVNAGIYALEPSQLTLPVEQRFLSMVTVINDLLERGRPVHTFDIDDWEDIGRVDDLRIARGHY